ncbi:MAG TPA: apolipoprotein N-acyltransferase [Rhodospirillaceae bacterium]|nr:apolipoprotein N-acyltransferase [Candidatus Neomarinimicrobiota bacterium]HCX14604.1 apolipoprotein N-acyltransferase [Rhodospirillaceae bacterium]
MIARGAELIGGLTGWRRLTASAIAGAVSIAAFPPISIVPVLWLSFPVLVWLLNGCSSRQEAASTGWAFGLGYFGASFYWITNAFYVDSEAFGIFAIPAVAGLVAFFGLYTALVCAITHTIPPPSRDDMPDDHVFITTLRILLFGSAWIVVEWLRGWFLTGFPWNPLATVWSETATPFGLPVLQSVPLIGTYGLSLLTVLAATAPAVLAHRPRLARAWVVACAPIMFLSLIAAGGALRLALSDTQFVPGIKLRLVQANISQVDKSRPSLWETHLRDHIQLSTKNRPGDVTHVIWGEAAVHFFLNVDEQHRRLAATAAPSGGMLITGADRGTRDESGQLQVYNTLYALTHLGDMLAEYDKSHLVPFGEYLPLRWLIPFEKLTRGMGDFGAGKGPVTLDLPGLPPFSPQICYEIIFPGSVTARESEKGRPDWLLNLTNDAWFGFSTGPYQHYAAARLRAVEEGIPIVRVANSGISAVIDGAGRTISEIGLGERGYLDAPLPRPASKFTPFGFMGNTIPLILALLVGGIALKQWRRYLIENTDNPFRGGRYHL